MSAFSWPRTTIINCLVFTTHFSDPVDFTFLQMVYIWFWNAALQTCWGEINVFTYCRCVIDMTALRRNTTRYIILSPGYLHLMLGNSFHLENLTCQVSNFVILWFSLPMNTVYKMGELSTCFIYFNIYTNDNRSN